MNARYIRATSGVVLKAFCPISVQKSVKDVSTLSSFLACAEVRCSERVVEVKAPWQLGSCFILNDSAYKSTVAEAGVRLPAMMYTFGSSLMAIRVTRFASCRILLNQGCLGKWGATKIPLALHARKKAHVAEIIGHGGCIHSCSCCPDEGSTALSTLRAAKQSVPTQSVRGVGVCQ